MLDQENVDQLMGATVHDSSGDKIGKVGQVYLDDNSSEPKWVTVNTGLFGMSESFVPLELASFSGDDALSVPVTKAQVKDAPQAATDGHLAPEEEAELYRYYGLSSNTEYDNGQNSGYDANAGEAVGRDTSGPTTDEAMTRSEERLNVGTERVETGRARLRKYVTTHTESVQVPVSREEVRLEREPITEANRGEALSVRAEQIDLDTDQDADGITDQNRNR